MITMTDNPHPKLEQFMGQKTCVLLLSCGHTHRVFRRPNVLAKYPCQAQQGCGYLLPWVSGVEGGFSFDNPKAQETAS